MRLAFVVSHPVQYYVPLYQRLAKRPGFSVKVFYTWQAARRGVHDPGFGRVVSWDLGLTEGYRFEVLPNRAAAPGSHHFWGLRNPQLVSAVRRFQPDAVHLTGYAFASHLRALYEFSRCRLPVFFRGDSHLLDSEPFVRRLLKRIGLRLVFRLPAAFLCVGMNNRAYYRAFGVPGSKLYSCPHSIDRRRFVVDREAREAEARAWRHRLKIADDTLVLLFAGKLEPKKRPLELMRAVAAMPRCKVTLLMVGDGECAPRVRELAAERPDRFRVLPFQNQSKMPVVYRLGDLFTLPSAYDETWGLAVNEAMACGRPVLVSDRVGCAADVVQPGINGYVFPKESWNQLTGVLQALSADRRRLRDLGVAAEETSRRFDIPVTEARLVEALEDYFGRPAGSSTSRADRT